MVTHAWGGWLGGYLEFIFRTAAKQLFGRTLAPGPLPLRALRNADMKDIVLEVDGLPVLRFAAAYGFRNIQTLVSALSLSSSLMSKNLGPETQPHGQNPGSFDYLITILIS